MPRFPPAVHRRVAGRGEPRLVSPLQGGPDRRLSGQPELCAFRRTRPRDHKRDRGGRRKRGGKCGVTATSCRARQPKALNSRGQSRLTKRTCPDAAVCCGGHKITRRTFLREESFGRRKAGGCFREIVAPHLPPAAAPPRGWTTVARRLLRRRYLTVFRACAFVLGWGGGGGGGGLAVLVKCLPSDGSQCRCCRVLLCCRMERRTILYRSHLFAAQLKKRMKKREVVRFKGNFHAQLLFFLHKIVQRGRLHAIPGIPRTL